MRNFFIPIIVSLLLACHSKTTDHSVQDRADIRKVEKDFEKMAAEKGMAEAFAFFADSNAVIRRRNDTIIHGKEGIRNFYSADLFRSASVTWEPDFVDVSPDGKLGYTYGHYTWQSKDSSGKPEESRGVFHTVWKKQKDGTWKYVWD